MKRIMFIAVAIACLVAGAQAQSYEKAKVWLVDQGPTIGPDLSFWDGLEGTKVDLRPWGGTEEEASGLCYFAADSKNLYFLARVTDAAPQENKKTADTSWQKTSVEFFFGTNTKKHSSFASGDSQIRVCGKSLADPTAIGMSKNGTSVAAKKYNGYIAWGEKSYAIQVAIPYEVLGITALTDGQPVRCEFRINHAKMGANRSVIVNWRTDGDTAYRDPGVWSDGVVVKRAK